MSISAVDTEFAFDPTDAAAAKDFERLARIRREKPICRPAENLVLFARYADTAAVFKDSKRFSSVGDMRAPGVVVPEAERFLGELDAPLHPKIRRILLKGFTRGGASHVESWIRDYVRARLGAMAQQGQGDLMADLAVGLPGSVSAHVLGLPAELHAPVMGWCLELLHSAWPTTGATPRGEGIAGSFPEFAACLDEQIRIRESGSAEAEDSADLLSIMVNLRDASGWGIGAHHVRTLVVNILAGSLSTSYMLGNLLYRALREPAFVAALRSDAQNLPRAVEESLRLEAPVTFLMRTALEDAEIGGEAIRRGEHLMLHIASANRDETAFAHADQFRLDREGEPPHLAFGVGPHICLGNHLTRVIGRVVLEEFLELMERTPFELEPDYVWTCVNHLQEYGPEALPVRRKQAIA
ncbi:MAG: cytochrome P450 [Myxococcota bacterium]